MIFDLAEPITWSDIISASASIFTFVAVIVAIIGNKNGRKQLKASLKIQEQSKNVELLDQRIAIVEAIKRDDAVSSLKVRLLFSEKVYRSYQELLEAKKQEVRARSDERKYFSLARKQLQDVVNDLPDGYDLRGYLYELAENEADDELYKFCDANEVIDYTKDNNGVVVETLTYNYGEILQRQANASEKIRKTRNEFLSLAEQDIKESIAPITNDKHRCCMKFRFKIHK